MLNSELFMQIFVYLNFFSWFSCYIVSRHWMWPSFHMSWQPYMDWAMASSWELRGPCSIVSPWTEITPLSNVLWRSYIDMVGTMPSPWKRFPLHEHDLSLYCSLQRDHAPIACFMAALQRYGCLKEIKHFYPSNIWKCTF